MHLKVETLEYSISGLLSREAPFSRKGYRPITELHGVIDAAVIMLERAVNNLLLV